MRPDQIALTISTALLAVWFVWACVIGYWPGEGLLVHGIGVAGAVVAAVGQRLRDRSKFPRK